MLLFCLLAAYLIVRVSEDVSASVRGHTPPRHEYRMAKLSARERGGGQMPQSPAGRYLSGLLNDAWDSAHHRHELMADHRKDKREQRAANRIERSRNRAAGKAEKHRQPDPVGFDVDAPTAVTDPDAGDPDAGRPEVADPDTGDDTGTNEPARGESATGDSAPANATEPAAEQAGTETDPDPTTGDSPTVEPVTGESEPITEEASEPAATSDDTTGPDTTPITETTTPSAEPLSAGHPSTETPHRMELPVTAPTTEVTGLTSAISYAEGLESFCTQTSDTVSSLVPTAETAISSAEQAKENLSLGGVTGQAQTEVASVQDEMTEAIRAIHTALSQLEAAGSSAAALKATLIQHQQTVGDAYTANPDAGSKEFVTAE